jgi:uncharacterized protein YbjQ (UPF0145 family)
MDISVNYWKLAYFLVLVVLGYGAGTLAENRHYRSIRKREAALATLLVCNTCCDSKAESVLRAELVIGSVVISIDFCKRILALLRIMLGGRVASYETLIDRARREAVLRLKQQARHLGADMVLNLRLETSAIGYNANRGRQLGSVEAIAYGTAVILRRKENAGTGAER